MFTALSDRGSFGGVFFYLSDYELKSSFHNETLEFITDHPPETRLYKKAPREIPVSGFLCGDDAVMARDLLLRVASSSTPRTLFLPSLGFVSALFEWTWTGTRGLRNPTRKFLSHRRPR